MFDVLYIADTFLKIAKKKDKGLTPIQLMKLVYLSHGWSLAIRDKALFRNSIEAWRHGPIIPDLYYATAKYGKSLIPFTVIGDTDKLAVTTGDIELIKVVFEKYGHLDGVFLSYLTNQAGTPWSLVQSDLGLIEIKDSLIAQYFKDILKRSSREFKRL